MNTRRVTSVTAAVTFAVIVASPNRAHAQPVCATGTVADYVALAGGCQLGGVTFSSFQGIFSGVANPLDGVIVTPVSSPGQVGFGLALNPPLSVVSNNGSFITPAETQSFEFDFFASGAGPGAMFGVSPFSLFTASVSAAAGAPRTFSARAALDAFAQGSNATVIVDTRQAGGESATSSCVVAAPDTMDVPCAPLVTTGFADGLVKLTGSVIAFGADPFPSSASLQNLSVVILTSPTPPPTVTPEPAPLLLLGSGGLLLLVGTRRRRRVAAADETV